MDSRRDFSVLKQVCWNFEPNPDPDQIFVRTQESNRSRHLLIQMQEGWKSLQSASGCSLNIHDFICINIYVWSMMKVWYIKLSYHLQWDNIFYRQARVRSQVPSAEPVNVVQLLQMLNICLLQHCANLERKFNPIFRFGTRWGLRMWWLAIPVPQVPSISFGTITVSNEDQKDQTTARKKLGWEPNGQDGFGI